MLGETFFVLILIILFFIWLGGFENRSFGQKQNITPQPIQNWDAPSKAFEKAMRDVITNAQKNHINLKQRKEIMENADKLYEKNEFTKAIKLYIKAINHPSTIESYDKAFSESDLVKCYYNRGQCKLKTNNYDGAILDFSKVIKKRGNYIDAYAQRAIAYEKKGDNKKAQKDRKKADILSQPEIFVKGIKYKQFIPIDESKEGVQVKKGVFGYEYTGGLKDGKFHGKGVYCGANGGRYEGDFKDGYRHGKGVYYFVNGDRYEGDSKEGRRHGKGVYYYANGDRYEGDFLDDKHQGKGVYYFANGDRYEGDYSNGKRQGKGIFYFKSGNRYEGEFFEDTFQGKGIFYFKSGARYEGDFFQSTLYGKGVHYYANGDRYEGDTDGVRHGKGVYYYANGDRYEGDSSRGKHHGKGVYYYANGDRYEGVYSNGKRHGKGTHYSANGKTRQEHYLEGLLIEQSKQEKPRQESLNKNLSPFFRTTKLSPLFKEAWHLCYYIKQERETDLLSRKIISFKNGVQEDIDKWTQWVITAISNLDEDFDCVIGSLGSSELLTNLDSPISKLCKSISIKYRIVYDTKLLRKKHVTNKLSHTKNLTERRNTLSNVFYVTPNQIQGYKKILLIDDVLTSGTTAKAIGQAIKAVKPDVELYFISLAKTKSEANANNLINNNFQNPKTTIKDVFDDDWFNLDVGYDSSNDLPF